MPLQQSSQLPTSTSTHTPHPAPRTPSTHILDGESVNRSCASVLTQGRGGAPRPACTCMAPWPACMAAATEAHSPRPRSLADATAAKAAAKNRNTVRILAYLASVFEGRWETELETTKLRCVCWPSPPPAGGRARARARAAGRARDRELHGFSELSSQWDNQTLLVAGPRSANSMCMYLVANPRSARIPPVGKSRTVFSRTI